MNCQFHRETSYKRGKLSHTKSICDLTNEYCISETNVCERRDYAIARGVGGGNTQDSPKKRQGKGRDPVTPMLI